MLFPQLFQTQAWNGKNLPKCFNLYLALNLASKSFLNTCLVLYLATYYRSKMQVSSALVSFVGSENPQTSLVFRSLIRTLAFAEGTRAWKKSKQVLFFRSLIRTFAYSYAEA